MDPWTVEYPPGYFFNVFGGVFPQGKGVKFVGVLYEYFIKSFASQMGLAVVYFNRLAAA